MAAALPAMTSRGSKPPYDDPIDEYHKRLLLDDIGSAKGILYFTEDVAYVEYCSEMNAWVSPLAGRDDYFLAKDLLESFTADLPDVRVAVNFLLAKYSNHIDLLIENYECILYDTKSAKYDFAFYYMIECFLRKLESYALANPAPPPVIVAGQDPIAPATPPYVTGGAVGGPSPARTEVFPSPTMASPSHSQTSVLSGHAGERIYGATSDDGAEAAPPPAPRSPPAAARSPSPAAAPPPAQPQNPYINLTFPQITNLKKYLYTLYQGPRDLIFDEEITQFHMALLIKYMN